MIERLVVVTLKNKNIIACLLELIVLANNRAFNKILNRVNMKKILKFIVVIIVVTVIVGFWGLNKIAPYSIIEPYRVNENYTPAEFGLESEKIVLYGVDSVELSAYWVKSLQDSVKGIVILVHGIGSCKEHNLTKARLLAEQGVESIVFDGRAHGESGGDYTTYGYYEKNDVSKIVEYLKAQEPALTIGIWGHSLGGAIAVQSLEIDDRIEFGVIESAFTEMDQIVFDYSKRMMKGIGIKFVSNYALKRAGKIAHFNPEEVKPIRSVKKIEQPTLFVHGDEDQRISVLYSEQLYANLKSSDKELYVIQGAGHVNLLEVGGEEYTSRVLGFINNNLNYEMLGYISLNKGEGL